MSDTTHKPDDDTDDDKVDDAVEDTFPASDPPAIGGSTGPQDGTAPPAPPPPVSACTPSALDPYLPCLHCTRYACLLPPWPEL